MNVKAILLCILPICANGQGFAGLGETADGFAVPTAGYDFTFPADHGAHPEFRIEWWYVTANLAGPDGTQYGAQWTVFRNALEPEMGTGWGAPQIWLGHAALTTPTDHYFAERFGRSGIGQAGAKDTALDVWIDEWELTDNHMTAQGADWAYDLKLQFDGPLVFHGDNGLSVKSSAGQASYYYSQPYIRVSGSIFADGAEIPVTGQAWMDREWSSQPLASDQSGWDWFSLSFDTGDKLMGFQLRGTDTYTSASWISADGGVTAYSDGAFLAEPITVHETAGVTLPVEWRVTLPLQGVDVIVNAINPDAYLPVSVPYWEGPVTVTGSHGGVGYLEMTGYD